MPLHRFEADGNTYTLPATLGAYGDNFGDVVTRTTRLPGVDGGFDEYLSEVGSREIGSIRQAFTLQSSTKAGLDAMRDLVNAMLGWGKGYLYMRLSNYTSQEWRVRARVSNIQMSRDEGDARNLYWQRVTVIWQCNHPLWEAAGNISESEINHSGTETTGGGSNGGNAIAIPTFVIETGVSGILTAPWYIRRIVDTTVVADEIAYGYTLPADTILTINCAAGTIVWNDGVDLLDGYDGTFEFLHPDWFRLLPGVNVVRVVSADAGDDADVTMQYRSARY
jgi:hypothetical protein